MNNNRYMTQPRGGINPWEVEKVRRTIKIGDRISIVTEKGYVNLEPNPKNTRAGGALRRGTVIAKHKHLVVLRYPGGLTESFRWSELADRVRE